MRTDPQYIPIGQQQEGTNKPQKYEVNQDFINDLPGGVRSSYKIFADDTKIYDKASNGRRMQEDIDRLQRSME